MLIYNKNLSVCPLTTHLPVKLISKNISKKLIHNKLKMINDFYLKIFKFKPKIAVVGLNPHCESILKFNEDEKIVTPAIRFSKKNNILASGPYSADTIFLKQNRNKFSNSIQLSKSNCNQSNCTTKISGYSRLAIFSKSRKNLWSQTIIRKRLQNPDRALQPRAAQACRNRHGFQ